MSEEATLDEFAGSSDTGDSQERQETPIGELPADWGVEWLNDITEINPDGFSEDDWPSETFEYISLSEASDGEIEYSQTTPIEDAPSRAQRTVQQGDVLVGTVRPKQRSHGFVSEEHDGKICSSGFGVLRPGTRLNSRYLLQEILSNRFFSQMEAYVAGSGYPAVKISDLKKHRVAIPPLSEQRKIATVLHNVDKAIHKTGEIISQKEIVREGLIENLFTKGYHSHSGSKKDVFGSYPSEWRYVSLNELIVEGPQNGLYKPSSAYGSGVPIVELADLYDNDFSINHNGFRELNLSESEEENYKLNEEDIIINRVSKQVSGVGKALKIGFTEDVVFESNMIRLRLSDEVIPEYFVYFTNSQHYSSYIDAVAKHSSQASIGQTAVKNLKLPLPEKEEQRRIVEVIDTICEDIKLEKQHKIGLEHIKQGLMQDIISGNNRTTDTNIEVPEEIAQYG